MKVVESVTGFVVKKVETIDEGYRVINSCEKEAEICGYDKPYLDIVDENGSSLLDY